MFSRDFTVAFNPKTSYLQPSYKISGPEGSKTTARVTVKVLPHGPCFNGTFNPINQEGFSDESSRFLLIRKAQAHLFFKSCSSLVTLLVTVETKLDVFNDVFVEGERWKDLEGLKGQILNLDFKFKFQGTSDELQVHKFVLAGRKELMIAVEMLVNTSVLSLMSLFSKKP